MHSPESNLYPLKGLNSMFRRLPLLVSAFTLVGLTLSATSASAGPIYTFSTSVGTQPSNVGVITLTQINTTTVGVKVDLSDTTLPAPQYGFLNTGGPHTPFAFNLGGSETGVSATFLQPLGGNYGFGMFSLSTANGDNTPFGTYGISINSTAGNGSGNAYYGDLIFLVSRTGGLSTDDFVTNGTAYFSADLTNGQNTGAQAWNSRVEGGDPCLECTPDQQTTVPEPASMLLLGTGLLAVARARRRNKVN